MIYREGIFNGKRVLVTGGGTGIGFAIASMFLELGAKVIIASRKEEKLRAAIELLSRKGDCRYLVLDIREPEKIEQVADDILKHEAGLDILINNAGGQFPSLAEGISYKGWNAVINNNLNGTWFMTQIMANRFFIPQKQGSIINIIANIFRGFPGLAHTGAARAGVENITMTLAVEWARHNIRINAVAPGVIKSSGLENYPEDLMAGMEKNIPQKRLGSVDEVASLVLYLSTSSASFITGETIYIDGGQRLSGEVFKIDDLGV